MANDVKKYKGDDVYQMLCKTLEMSLNQTLPPEHAREAVGAGKALADMMKYQLEANKLAFRAREVGVKVNNMDHFGGSIIDFDSIEDDSVQDRAKAEIEAAERARLAYKGEQKFEPQDK